VLELPIGHFDEKPYLYVLASTAHHVPILNGVSGFEPPSHSDLRQRIEDGKIDDELFTRLERYGCRVLILHADWLQPHTARFGVWLRAALDSGRLGFIGRFDNGLPDGDWVFALTRTDRQWSRLRLPQALNAAGQTPDESLARFLGGKPTYSGSTIAWLDEPVFNREIPRDLRVSGWALAPSGIRRVRVIVNCGSMSFPAKLSDRGDVQQKFPWYPAVQKAGFVMQFEKRPKGIPRDTSFQVEIEDGNGRILRMPNRWIHWL
jgi:hypothetical protein